MNAPKSQITSYQLIGNIIPVNNVTLVIGLTSTGKTYSVIKFLNSNNITPIVINLDQSPNRPALKYHALEGSTVVKLVAGDFTDLADKVIIIDTYQLMMDELGSDNSDKDQKDIAKRLTELATKESCTIIVLGHCEDFASKEGIFTENKYLVRSCAEQLIMTSKSTNKIAGNNTVHYSTVVKKNRANTGGTQILDNWMRD